MGLMVLLIYNPYSRKLDDRLHCFAQVEIFLLLFAGQIFFMNSDINATDDLALSVLLIGMVIAFFTFFLYQAGRVIYEKCKRDQTETENLPDFNSEDELGLDNNLDGSDINN